MGWWLGEIIGMMIARVFLPTLHSPLTKVPDSPSPGSGTYFSIPNPATWIWPQLSGVHLLTAFLVWFARARSCGTPEFHWDSGHLAQGQLARTCREKWHHHRYQLLSLLLFIFFSVQCVWGVECVVAVKNCVMEHLGRIWAIADFLAPPLGNWDVTRECYTKYSSNYWQLMIVVTGKAVCVRNQLLTGCLVLLNPPWPPPALLNFWKFVRPFLAFAPRMGGPYMEFTAAKSGLASLSLAIKTKPEISRILLCDQVVWLWTAWQNLHVIT